MRPPRFFIALALGAALSVLQTAALAQDRSDWQDGGGTLATDPSCAAYGTGEVLCGAVGSNGTLIVNRFDGSTWTGFQDLGGIVVRKPSCMRIGILAAACAVIDVESRLQVNIFNGSAWSGFQLLGGTSVSDPACVGRPNIGLIETHCIFVGVEGVLYAGRFVGNQWQGIQKLGGNYLFNPTCTQDWVLFGNGIFCAVVTATGRLEGWVYSGTWNKLPQTVGSNITADPHCAGIGVNQILCAVRSGTRLKVNRADDASTWPVFTDLGGILTAAPSCMPATNPYLAPTTATCAVRATNSVVHMIDFDGRGWGSFQPSPGVIMVGQPSCVFFGSDGTLCAVRGTDNRFYSRLSP